MLGTTWAMARRWAAEARAQQRTARRQARWSLVIAAAAAFLAAIAAAIGAPPPVQSGQMVPLNWISTVSLVAGLLAAASAIFGRFVLSGQAEAKWIAARAAAEATQSECYRYAAHAAPYDNDRRVAAATFDQITRGIVESARAKGATGLGEASANPDRPPPPDEMDACWYQANRLEKQQAWYLVRGSEHRKHSERLRLLALGFSFLAAALGIAGAVHGLQFLTAFVGAVTTVAAALAANGALERQSFLAGSYAGMADAIDNLRGRHSEGLLSDMQLVVEGETLLSAEYRVWADRMALPTKDAKD